MRWVLCVDANPGRDLRSEIGEMRAEIAELRQDRAVGLSEEEEELDEV